MSKIFAYTATQQRAERRASNILTVASVPKQVRQSVCHCRKLHNLFKKTFSAKSTMNNNTVIDDATRSIIVTVFMQFTRQTQR